MDIVCAKTYFKKEIYEKKRRGRGREVKVRLYDKSERAEWR